MQLTDSEIEIVRAEVSRLSRVDVAQISDDTDFVSELGMGSLELLNLLAFVEQRWGIMIPDESLISLTSISLIRLRFDSFTLKEHD